MDSVQRRAAWRGPALALCLGGLAPLAAWAECGPPAAVYLTLETGSMALAPMVADVLKRQGVVATFFLANERTPDGGYSLDDEWTQWWRARVGEGHRFASLTWDYWVGKQDEPDGASMTVRPGVGVDEGQRLTVDAPAYCQALQQPADRLQTATTQGMLPLFRAPEGKSSPLLRRTAEACGWRQAPWTEHGNLDDLVKEGRALTDGDVRRLAKAIQPGEVLRLRLGRLGHKAAWTSSTLTALIKSLKSRELCFATLDARPDHAAWVEARPPKP